MKWTAHISNKVLETRKLNADRNAVKSTEISLATQFSKLADLVRADVHAYKEVALTAFSLHPTKERFDKLVELAAAVGEIATESDGEQVGSLGAILGLPKFLIMDIFNVARYCRWDLLTWREGWTHLKPLCQKYMAEKDEMTYKTTYATLNSFRPISLVSNLAKILEKIILNRLQWYAKNGNWISSNLHGFTEGRSTETACHSLVSFIENGFNCKQVTACTFLDIKSAFDMAWHLAILAALIKRGCPRYLVCLVHNFLSNRKGVFTHYGAHLFVNVDLRCPQVGCSLRSCETCSLTTF